MSRLWSQGEITVDLVRLRDEKANPTPYELKEKYGYASLSVFFPILENIRNAEPGLSNFVKSVFSRVTDRRDLHFIYRGCNSSCAT